MGGDKINKTKSMVFIIIMLLLSLSFFPSSVSQIHPLGISGFVYDTAGNPLVGATVNVTNVNTEDTDTATTNNNGQYAVSLEGFNTDVLTATAKYGGLSGTNTTLVDTSNKTQWINITLGAGLVARFSYYPAIPAPGKEVKFMDRSIGTIDAWHWKFGDGITAVGKNVNHVYTEEGEYTVTLTAWSGTLLDRKQKTITVSTVSGQTPGPWIPDLKPPEYPFGYTVGECYSIINADKLPNSDHDVSLVVIDSGVYPTQYDGVDLSTIDSMAHPDFSNGRDEYGHGTFINYEIAYLLQKKTPNARHLSYKIFDSNGQCTQERFLESFDEIIKMNPDVVSISAGAFGNSRDGYSRKVKELRERGVIVIVAAGNYGPESSTILSPACSEHALAVGASNPERTVQDISDDTICPWSSRGPVGNVDEPKPDIVAPGESIRGLWLTTPQVKSGTSLSTPLVASSTVVIVANEKPLIDLVETLWFFDKTVIPDAYEDALEQGTIHKGNENTWGAGIIQMDKVADAFHWNLIWLIVIPIILWAVIILIIVVIWFKREAICDFIGL